MKTTIVFFSKDGNTRTSAKFLAEKTGADIVELKEKRKGGMFKAMMKKPSKLLDNPENTIVNSDVVYIMTPIWASNGTPAVNAFCAAADFSGKTVNIVHLSQIPEHRDSELVHEHIASLVRAKGGTIGKCTALCGGGIKQPVDEAAIKAQTDMIKTD